MSTRVDLHQLTEFATFAEHLADAAGAAILPHFRSNPPVDDKSGGHAFDPVTDADRAAEQVVRAMIAEAYPDHGIVGEEFGEKSGSSPYTWVIDPIDGTRAFISGLPVWGTLIGLSDAERPILGVMDQPFLGERFLGYGRYAHHEGPDGRVRLKTRATTSLAEATLCVTTPEMFAPGRERERFWAAAERAQLLRFGTDCYGYAMLAHGFVDLVIEADLKPFDIQPLIPIVEAAGGVVTSWDGGSALEGGAVIAAATPALHEEALAALAP